MWLQRSRVQSQVESPLAVIFLTATLGAMMSFEVSGMFQKRAAHNGADQPRKALCTPR
jgi:hypothetical protein